MEPPTDAPGVWRIRVMLADFCNYYAGRARQA
jgi:hypothetical protein